MDVRPACFVAVLMLVASACDDSTGSPATTTRPSATESVVADLEATELLVTKDTEKGPASCSPRAVGELVVGFLGSINNGDFEASRYFAPDMEWYSAGGWTRRSGKTHFVSYGYEPEKLEAHFEERAAQNERIYLYEIDVAFERERNLGHVVYAIERTADDFPRTDPLVTGKGAIACDTGKISVWSMSHDTRFQRVPEICPGKPDPPETAIACARA